MGLGAVAAATSAGAGTALFERPKGQERTFHRLAQPVRGGQLTFTNVEQETPIGELSAPTTSTPAAEPDGHRPPDLPPDGRASSPIQPSVQRRSSASSTAATRADERATMVALPGGRLAAAATARRAGRALRGGAAASCTSSSRPTSATPTAARGARSSTYSWVNMPGGLDGIAIDLPALNVKPTHGAYFPLNIQVKDPIWPLRNMLDVSVSVKPGEPHTIWLDTRDRILPNDKRPVPHHRRRGRRLRPGVARGRRGPAGLQGAQGRRSPSTSLDRFTQVRDNYAHIVEESPRTRRLNLYNRFETDLTDLLRVDPDHVLGRQYWYDYNREQPRPPVALPAPSRRRAAVGVPPGRVARATSSAS